MIFRKLEQQIVKDINESGMSIDAIYFIMKSIMQEIEQRYFEFCRQEDMEKQNKEMLKEDSNKINEEFNSDNEEAS